MWTIGIIATAPRLAILSQDDQRWQISEPTTQVEAANGTLFAYVVDGGLYADGFNTGAYPT